MKRYIPTWKDMEWVVLDKETGAIKHRFGRHWYSREYAIDKARELNGEFATN